MTNNLYCVLNTLSGRYGDVVAYPTDGFALARLSEALRDRKSEYTVTRVGSIDVETGHVTASVGPVVVPWTSSGSPADNGVILDNKNN